MGGDEKIFLIEGISGYYTSPQSLCDEINLKILSSINLINGVVRTKREMDVNDNIPLEKKKDGFTRISSIPGVRYINDRITPSEFFERGVRGIKDESDIIESETSNPPKFRYSSDLNRIIIHSNDYYIELCSESNVIFGVSHASSTPVKISSGEERVCMFNPNLNAFQPSSFLVISNICVPSFFAQKRPRILKFSEYINSTHDDNFFIQYKSLDFVNLDFGDFEEVRMKLIDNNGTPLKINQGGTVLLQLRF